ncbi:hypothetical protein [Cohnella silvisoli]|uniref:Uncharacterized protein n=1 Tax=Cohnella silvisoli TaxID=2873699 RepID=A0ABV1KSM2_9BACL|nr:hypothetical protein [Cohnella silvisoli]MCD9022664.1 hypothetical protein [Cohnella silvisoli]
MDRIGSVFRKHPELEPTGKLSILGAACCSAERMNAYVKRRNPKAPEIAELYLRQGERYGVRGDVAYCQMVYETRGWTAEISGPSWAPITLNQWSEEGSVEQQMQILHTFAANGAMPQDAKIAQRSIALIERAGWRGRVVCWEDLNGKWSVAGNRYGQDIVAMWRNMIEWRGEGEVTMEQPNEGDYSRSGIARERINGNVDWSSISNEEMNWLKGQQLLPDPVPHPDRKVTWAELAVLLHRWENRPPTATIEANKVSS